MIHARIKHTGELPTDLRQERMTLCIRYSEIVCGPIICVLEGPASKRLYNSSLMDHGKVLVHAATRKDVDLIEYELYTQRCNQHSQMIDLT